MSARRSPGPHARLAPIAADVMLRARLSILRTLADAPAGMWIADLREAVISATITERVFRAARATLVADGLADGAQHVTITDAGRAELAARRAA